MSKLQQNISLILNDHKKNDRLFWKGMSVVDVKRLPRDMTSVFTATLDMFAAAIVSNLLLINSLSLLEFPLLSSPLRGILTVLRPMKIGSL